jgi:uncharacterized protein involved in exopolysaccharide biosynthesis
MGKTILITISLILILLNLTSCVDQAKYENLQSQLAQLDAVNQNLHSNYSTLKAQYADLSSAYEDLYSDYADLHSEFIIAKKQVQDLVDFVDAISLDLANQSLFRQSYYPPTSQPTWSELQQQFVLQQQEYLQRLQIAELNRQAAERRLQEQRELEEQIRASFFGK